MNCMQSIKDLGSYPNCAVKISARTQTAHQGSLGQMTRDNGPSGARDLSVIRRISSSPGRNCESL